MEIKKKIARVEFYCQNCAKFLSAIEEEVSDDIHKWFVAFTRKKNVLYMATCTTCGSVLGIVLKDRKEREKNGRSHGSNTRNR